MCCFIAVFSCFSLSSRRRQTSGAVVTVVQTCALPICPAVHQSGGQSMKLILLPAIAGMVVAHPGLGQARAEPSTLKTVQSATRSATIEPATIGFVNGALVYPYSEGTIFQVYAAPGLVTDIALQPGENLVDRKSTRLNSSH